MGKATHILKHKNINAAHLWIEDGQIFDIIEIKEPDHLPYKYENNKEKNIRLLNNWLDKRGIPFSRDDYDLIMDKYNVRTSKELTILGNGLNLTDHFWLCDINNEKSWEEVNFFENNFSARIGEILPELTEKYEEFANPDFSSNGKLNKFWVIDNNRRCLYKDGSGNLRQEPFNEHIASEICRLLDFDHVRYDLKTQNNKIFSSCECMVDKNIEFVNAFCVYLENEQTKERYNTYINICNKKGIYNAREEIDKMIILDFLISNTDRHTGNFGILRNSETLQWLKIAPIYDNGNSLWYSAEDIQYINAENKSKNKSFEKDNEANLALLGDTCWYKKSKLNNINEVIFNTLTKNEQMKHERIYKIIAEFGKNIHTLDRLLEQRIKSISPTSHDEPASQRSFKR